MNIFELLFDFSVDRNGLNQQLNQARDDIKWFKERIKDDTTIRLSDNVAELKVKLDGLRASLRQAKANKDYDLQVSIQSDIARTSQELTQAQRQLRNYARTWSEDVSVLWKKFQEVNNTIEKQWNIFQRTMASMKSWLSWVWKLLWWIFAVHKITQFTQKVFQLTSQVEQAKISFTTLLKSEEKALALLHDIDEFAKNTPFNKLGTIQATQRLLAMWFAGENVISVLRTIGDGVSAVGGTDETLNGLITAFGQIQTKGKLVQQELNQIAERWIPVFDILRDKLWLTSEQLGEVGKQGISASEWLQAIFEWMNERYGGAMEKQSKTLQGRRSNLVDSVEMKLAKFGATVSSVFWDAIDMMWDAVDSVSDQTMNAIGATIVSLFESVKSIWMAITSFIGEWFKTIWQLISLFYSDTAKGSEWTTSYLTGTWRDFFLVIALWIRSIVGAFSIMLRSVVWIMNLLKNHSGVVWRVMIAWRRNIAAMWVQAFVELAEKTQQLFNKIITKVNNTFWTTFDTMSWSFDDLKWFVKSSAEESSKALEEFKKVGQESFAGVGPEIDDLISDLAKTWESFNKTWDNAVDLDALLQTLYGWWKDGADNLTNATKWTTKAVDEQSKAYEEAKEIVIDTYKKVNDEIDKSKSALKKYGEDVEKVGEKFKDLQKEATESLQEIAKELYNLEKDQWNELAERYAQLKKDLEDVSDVDEYREIKKEMEIIEANTTEAQREQAIAYENLTEAEKKLLSFQEKRLALQEKQTFIENMNLAQFDEKWRQIKDWITWFQINDDYTAQYIDALGNVQKITDEKAIQYAQDMLNKQGELEAELNKIAQLEEAEQIAQASLYEEKTRLENEFNQVFNQNIIEQKNNVKELFTTRSVSANATKQSVDSLVQSMRQAIALQSQMRSSWWSWFAEWWYTGPWSKYQVAGVVHKWEYVIPKRMVNKYGWVVKQLEWIRWRGFAEWWYTSSTDKSINVGAITVNDSFDFDRALDNLRRKL